jgi:hypothetical protein
VFARAFQASVETGQASVEAGQASVEAIHASLRPFAFCAALRWYVDHVQLHDITGR